MKIYQTKCDHCERINGATDSVLSVTAHLSIKPGSEFHKNFDFCNEDCLREFLISRQIQQLKNAGKLDEVQAISNPDGGEGNPVEIQNQKAVEAAALAQLGKAFQKVGPLKIGRLNVEGSLLAKAEEGSRDADIKLMVEALRAGPSITIADRHKISTPTCECLTCQAADLRTKALATPTAKKYL